MLNIIIASCSIVAALIGAGFASGEEILCYFVVFGKHGVWGLTAVSLFFALFILSVLIYCIKNRITTYSEFLEIFKSTYSQRLIKGTTVIFSLAVYSAMLSALAEVIISIIPLSPAIAGLVVTILAVAVFIKGTDRVFAFNGVIGIGLVFFMTFAILYILTWREIHTFSPVVLRSAGDGFIYGGYNLVTLTPVLISLSKRLSSKNDALTVTLTATFITCLLIGLVFVLLSIYHNKIELGSLPLLTLAKRQSVGFGIFYTFILSFAIITTLLSSGGAVIDSLAIKEKPLYIGAVSILAYGLSGIGFSNLINIAYRLCGIAGIFVCSATIFAIIRNKKTPRKV